MPWWRIPLVGDAAAPGRALVLVDVPTGLPRVLADRRRVVQVLNNLFANAARHAPECSPSGSPPQARTGTSRFRFLYEGRGVALELPHVLQGVGGGEQGMIEELLPNPEDEESGLNRTDHGIGLSTSTSSGGVGAFSQRIPGLTDEAGWLQVLAAPETALLATRPATEVLAALPGAFDTWTVPTEAAGVLAALEAMGSGGRSYRNVWDDLEALAPAVLTEAQLRAVTGNPVVQTRLVDAHERAQAVSAADLVHAHAEAEAASFLARQVGEASAALADLRNDDLMRTQRVGQAQLAAAVTGTEIALAHAQLAAYEAAREARERYEAERARREALARWQADAVRARAGQDAFTAELAAVAGPLADSHRRVPSPTDW